jgi:hypothetical protein
MTRRALEVGGYVLLGSIMALVVLSYASVYGPKVEPGRLRTGAPLDVGGTIATYANDAMILAMSGGERRVVRIAESTTIVRIDRAATVDDLRPGRFVAVQVADWRMDGSVVAGGIMVW